jgi:hypothetical protein
MMSIPRVRIVWLAIGILAVAGSAEGPAGEADLNPDEVLECKLPKIPAQQVWRVKQFFQQVVDTFRRAGRAE